MNIEDSETKRDIDNAIIFCFLILSVFVSVLSPSLISMVLLYVTTLWFFNRVRLYNKFGILRYGSLAVIVQIFLPLLVGVFSIEYVSLIVKLLPDGTTAKVFYFIITYSYAAVPITLNLISHKVFSKHKHFYLNLKPALELGRMLIWGLTLSASIYVITEKIEDNFLKVSYLVVMAPLLLINYAIKITIESKSSRSEYEKAIEKDKLSRD